MTTARPRRRPATPADAMPERGHGGLQDRVERLVKDLRERTQERFRGYHTHISKNSPAGFPDFIFAGPGGFVVAELKREGEDPTLDQEWWLAMFRMFGVPAYVWRPSDLYSGLVTRELTALAGLPVHVPPGDVARLAGILRAAVSDTITPGLAENLARAAIRAGYTLTPRGTP